jgi:hypothetical protein
MSGWQDSNLRPPAPKAGALTGLRYTPNFILITKELTTFPILNRDALTGLRYTPNFILITKELTTFPILNRDALTPLLTGLNPGHIAERGGFEPPVGLPLRQFSKLLVSATHPPLRCTTNCQFTLTG